jgi:twinkle protein
VREAKPLDPDELKNAADFKASVIERYYPTDDTPQGFRLPWTKLHDYRLSWGEVTVIAGYSSHGKSTVAGHITLDAIDQKVLTCVASLEFKADKWLQWQVRQAVGTPTPTRDEIERSMDWLGERMWVIDTHKTAHLERILDVFRYAHRRYGVKLFVLDNFSKLSIPNDDFAAQALGINKITEFAIENNVHFILLHHLRKEETDFLSNNMSKLSLKGSSALGDMVDNIFLVWRNRKKEQRLKNPDFLELDEEEQDKIRMSLDTLIRCEKHRDGGDEPQLPLWFDTKSHLFVEKQGLPAKRYVK